MARGAEHAGIEQATVCPAADVMEFELVLLAALLAAVLGSHQGGVVDGLAEFSARGSHF